MFKKVCSKYRYVTGFIILCGIQFVCNYLVKTFHIILPSPILGIIVLALLLKFNIIKKEWIKDICNLLLKYMPLLFVPLFAGIIIYYSLIEKNLIPIIINILVTTTITLVLSALFVENIIKYIKFRKFKRIHND